MSICWLVTDPHHLPSFLGTHVYFNPLDHSYVLSHYKTELCKKPPRLCRQGYACPYYHNSKDRRRSPHKHKYRCSISARKRNIFCRSFVVYGWLWLCLTKVLLCCCVSPPRALPCPAVKQSEEWGDPSKCEGAEGCQYCHTRTEQQFHPEVCQLQQWHWVTLEQKPQGININVYWFTMSQIYKSTKCNDMQQSGSCPRGPFCAFAHIESKLPNPSTALWWFVLQFNTASYFAFFKPPLEPFVPEEPPFPTPSSPPPPRPPDPLSAQEASSSPSRHSMGPGAGSGSASDPFAPPAGLCVAEKGLLGNVLSLCDDLSGGADPSSPWAGEGRYCRAPGFEREDQVRRTDRQTWALTP